MYRLNVYIVIYRYTARVYTGEPEAKAFAAVKFAYGTVQVLFKSHRCSSRPDERRVVLLVREGVEQGGLEGQDGVAQPSAVDAFLIPEDGENGLN